MPRPNRYHPYNRGHTAAPAQSPRFQPAPTLAFATPPVHNVVEQDSNTYCYIYPNYIRGITSDGKALITRQILQGPDGMFHIQMEAVRFPSECLGPQVQPIRPSRIGLPIDPHIAAMQAVRPELMRRSVDSALDITSDSDRSRDEECAVSTDSEDEDADGEEDNDYNAQIQDAEIQVLLEQRKLMLRKIKEGKCGIMNDDIVV